MGIHYIFLTRALKILVKISENYQITYLFSYCLQAYIYKGAHCYYLLLNKESKIAFKKKVKAISTFVT